MRALTNSLPRAQFRPHDRRFPARSDYRRLHVIPVFSRFFLIPLCALLLLLLPAASQPASAHPLSVSNSTLQLQSGSIELVFAIDDLSVIESVEGTDLNRDQALETPEVEKAQAAIASWLNSSLTVSAADRPLKGEPASVTLQAKGGKRMVVAVLKYAPPAEAKSFRYEDKLYLDNGTTYVDLLVIKSGNQTAEKALNGDSRTAAFTIDEQGLRMGVEAASAGTAGSLDKTAGASSRNQSAPASANPAGNAASAGDHSDSGSAWSSFFLLGIRHILTGYDHLLFLLALLLRKQKLMDYVKIASAFTVAHSLTLTLAVLGWNPLPSRLIEVLIALSIAYVAVENLFGLNRGRRWQLTFAFGLVHGLGFAGILAELDIPKSHLAASLVSFNLGIEVVQIGLIAAASPLLRLFQDSRLYRRGFAVGSTLILGISALWIVERML